MIKSEEIYEVVNQTFRIAGQIYGDCRFRGNIAYGKVLGFGVIIKSLSGSSPNFTVGGDYTGFAKIGARESGGGNRTLMAPVPYEYIKLSPQVQFSERFVELNGVDANSSDFVVNVEVPNNTINVEVQVTVLYSKA